MKNEERQIVLSVFWSGPKHFIVQTTADVSPTFDFKFYDKTFIRKLDATFYNTCNHLKKTVTKVMSSF